MARTNFMGLAAFDMAAQWLAEVRPGRQTFSTAFSTASTGRVL
jgi:hypothetical protein